MIFKKLESYVTDIPAGSVFVEIGSDRYEGSTTELDRLAGIHHTKLITVDVLPDAKQRLEHQLINTEFVISDGRIWANQYTGPAIACLYLDNFDYNWDINNHENFVSKQITEYSQRGVSMNNQMCQIEHMAQLLALYKHLTPDAVVMFDDTYQYNDCWIGKCGPAVIYLLTQGWKILAQSSDCGAIMKKTVDL